MVQKADILKARSNKRKAGRDSRGRTRQPSEKKREVVQVYVVTAAAIEATALKQYIGGSPKCNQCGFHQNGAC